MGSKYRCVKYILDPYSIVAYCTFYLTKVNKYVTQKMQSMLKKCKHEQYEAFKQIKKLGNTFLNAQQMSIQQAMHISLSIPFYHSTRSFQFINTCNEHERTFVLLPQKILRNSTPTSTNIQCKSLVYKYKEWHHSLENISLQNLLLVMTLKHVKNMDMIKLFVGFHSIFIRTQKIIIKNYYFFSIIFANQKLI